MPEQTPRTLGHSKQKTTAAVTTTVSHQKPINSGHRSKVSSVSILTSPIPSQLPLPRKISIAIRSIFAVTDFFCISVFLYGSDSASSSPNKTSRDV